MRRWERMRHRPTTDGQAHQRDLWAAFDYAAWEPDEWVLKSKLEPGAVALRYSICPRHSKRPSEPA